MGKKRKMHGQGLGPQLENWWAATARQCRLCVFTRTIILQNMTPNSQKCVPFLDHKVPHQTWAPKALEQQKIAGRALSFTQMEDGDRLRAGLNLNAWKGRGKLRLQNLPAEKHVFYQQ